MSKRSQSDQLAMQFAIQKLESLGLSCLDLNTIQPNYPNSDLRVTGGTRVCHVQMKGKLQKKLNWISVGYANANKISSGKLFNNAEGGTHRDVVMSVVMSAHDRDAGIRFFVFPVADANIIFLQHARYHVSRLTRQDNKRSSNIELSTFVGPGTHRVSNILDLAARVLPYEDAFHHMGLQNLALIR